MISNIPIFRAKKLDSNEYVEGSLIQSRFIFKEWIDDVWTSFRETRSNKAEVYEIDPTTLSIHFLDMLDSKGNKIFASLQEDGKGGDILKGQVYGISKGKVWDMVAEYKDTSIWLTRYINNNAHISMPLVYQKNGYRDMKVIGIQE